MGMRKAFPVTCAVALALVARAGPCLAADEPDPLPDSSPRPATAPSPPYWLELTPSWTHAFASRSVSFEAVGVGLELLLDRPGRFGVGLAGALYGPFSQTRAPVPSSFPATETLGAALAEFRWTAVRTHRAELGLLGGVGTVATRPLSLVDPAHRAFSYDTRLAMSLGASARVYLTREVALSLEARDVVYVDQLESANVEARSPNDPSYWYGARPLTSVLETRVGLTVFLFRREPR